MGQSMTAQLGIRTKYLSNDIDDNQAKILNPFLRNNQNPLSNGFGIGVDYSINLKNSKIIFLPEIGINYSSSSSTDDFLNGLELNYTYIYFIMNTRIYPLDLNGNRDCPTFSNQNSLIKKGFHFEFSPGLGYYQTYTGYWSYSTEPGFETEVSSISYKIGLGMGLDFGINNLITMTPYVVYNYHFERNYLMGLLSRFQNIVTDQGGNDMSQLELGLRFAIRFDAKNY